MSGRRPIPGDKGLAIAMEQRAVLNRTIRAQVTNVDSKNGFVKLTYDGLPSGGRHATIEPLWMSFPSSGRPAWGRFIPQESDMVKVTFDYDDYAKITGYDVVANRADIADGRSGWPELAAQYEKFISGENDDRPQFANFISLNPGEYDFMSSGGAYIYGNNAGRLYMAGGPVSISIIKNEMRILSRSQLSTTIADDSEMRFGQVRRADAQGNEKVISSDTNGALKEFNVSVAASSPKATLGVFKLGNVVDDTAEVQSSQGNPLRMLLQVYTDASSKTYEMSVDKLGNMSIESSSAEFIMNYNKYKFTAAQEFVVSSPTIKLGGDDSSHPLILSNTYQSAETQMLSQMASGMQSLAQQMSAIMTLVSTALGVSVPAGPAVGAVLSAGAVAAVSTGRIPIEAGVTAAVQQVNLAVQQFNSNYSNYLSQVSKTS